jgi:hypothetical protein
MYGAVERGLGLMLRRLGIGGRAYHFRGLYLRELGGLNELKAIAIVKEWKLGGGGLGRVVC